MDDNGQERVNDGVGWADALGEHAANPPTPKQTGDVIVSASGEEFRVSSCENRIKAQFEQQIRRNAVVAIAEVEKTFGPEQAQQMRDSYLASVASGHYTWDGRHCRRAREDFPGIRLLLFLLLRRCHPEVTEDRAGKLFVERPAECVSAIEWSLGNSSSSPSKDGGEDKMRTTTNGHSASSVLRELEELKKRMETLAPATMDGL